MGIYRPCDLYTSPGDIRLVAILATEDIIADPFHGTGAKESPDFLHLQLRHGFLGPERDQMARNLGRVVEHRNVEFGEIE